MAALQKLQLAVVLGALVAAMPAEAETLPEAGADEAPLGPRPIPGDPADDRLVAEAGDLDRLFAELAEPGRKDWERIEAEIDRAWSRSGSPTIDLLLRRGRDAITAEAYPKAIEHLSALIDHAPDFAEGYNTRATAYFLEGNFALALSDVEHVLFLNPRHFGALTGLGSMFESMDQPQLALEAMRMAEKLNPNRPSIKEAISRLERQTGEVDL